MARTTVEIEDGLWRDARKRALDEGRPVAEILAAALMAYLGEAAPLGGARNDGAAALAPSMQSPETMAATRAYAKELMGDLIHKTVGATYPGSEVDALKAVEDTIKANSVERPTWAPPPKPKSKLKRDWHTPAKPTGTPCFQCGCRGGVQAPKTCRLYGCACHVGADPNKMPASRRCHTCQCTAGVQGPRCRVIGCRCHQASA